MKANKYIPMLLITGTSVVFTNTAYADQVISDDLIVNGGSICVGIDCADLEVFDFDTIKLKGNDPQILFNDTSNSASFPSNDWLLGVTDNAQGGPADFFIKDVNADVYVLVLQAGTAGGVALGAGSTVEPNAVSVGSMGNERQIKHVADGVDQTDAINMSQFSTMAASLNARIDAINVRIDGLLDRISKL
jgi:hypothetical protein